MADASSNTFYEYIATAMSHHFRVTDTFVVFVEIFEKEVSFHILLRIRRSGVLLPFFYT